MRLEPPAAQASLIRPVSFDTALFVHQDSHFVTICCHSGKPTGVPPLTIWMRTAATRDGGRWGIGAVHKVLTCTAYIGRHPGSRWSSSSSRLSWRRLDGHNQLPKLITGVKFADGIEVVALPAEPQAQAA
jgi:hypothetical protein